MAALDTISIGILLAGLLLLGGILSSVIALRFGAPLLFVFLVLGMLGGGLLGIEFNDVRTAYTVGSVALAIILFDGGLRTRFAAFRSVLAPALTLATFGVLLTAALTAPVAKYLLDLRWIQALLVGAVVASTDAAAVFFLVHARGLRLRPRVAATLEVESGSNDPFAVFLTLLLVEMLLVGNLTWREAITTLLRDAALGGLIGYLGGRGIVLVLNRLGLAQGLHAPFVMTAALVLFGLASALHASGFLAVYLAGLVVGNRPTRAHRSVVAFLDAVTWLAQIVMFVLLGLLVWPQRLVGSMVPALGVAAALMLLARPISVFLSLAPFGFSWREKAFISWVGLRGAVGIFLASIPLLVGLPAAYLYFDIAFVVVLASLLIQGWTVAASANWLDIAFPRADPLSSRVELDLPGQLTRELVGYEVGARSPFLRRGILPNWAKLMLVVRDEQVLGAAEAGTVKEGDHAYFLAPLEKATALDRFLVDMPAPAGADPRLLGDFFVGGDLALGALADIYGVAVAESGAETPLSDYMTARLGRPPKTGDVLPLGEIALVAHTVSEGRVTTVGLRLAEPEEPAARAPTLMGRLRTTLRHAVRWLQAQ
jgi:potassium/hydrogen antiporter